MEENYEKEDLVVLNDLLTSNLKLKLSQSRNEIVSVAKDISVRVEDRQKSALNELNLVMNVISKLNPLEVLKNGYAIIEKDSKKILKSTNLKVGDEIVINTCDSKIAAQVKAIETKKEK